MAKSAVIINEFGEVGLDHSLVESSNEQIVELQNGCICCSIQSDLEETMQSLAGKRYANPGFQRVVIETTGLADPVPVIQLLMSSPHLLDLYHVDTVITVVDAVNGRHTLDAHSESRKQVALAEHLIVSKADLADRDTVEGLRQELQRINPTATITIGSSPNFSAASFTGTGEYDPYKKGDDVSEWLRVETYRTKSSGGHHHHHVNKHSDDIESFALTREEPIHPLAFQIFLEVMAAKVGKQFLRMKGIVNVQNESRPAVVHGVQHIFHPVRWLEDWPDEDHRTRLIFITQGIGKDMIEDLLNILTGAVVTFVQICEVLHSRSQRRSRTQHNHR